MRRWIVIGLVGVLGMAAVDGGAAPPPNVRGTVMRGPVVPVCIEGKACDAPAAGVVLVFTRGGSEVRRVTTGAGGRFALRLRSGAYVVRSVSQTRLGSVLQPTRFRVPQTGVAVLRLHIDSGIR